MVTRKLLPGLVKLSVSPDEAFNSTRLLGHGELGDEPTQLSEMPPLTLRVVSGLVTSRDPGFPPVRSKDGGGMPPEVVPALVGLA